MSRWACAFVTALAAFSQRAGAITQEEGVAALAEFKDQEALVLRCENELREKLCLTAEQAKRLQIAMPEDQRAKASAAIRASRRPSPRTGPSRRPW